MSTSSALEVVAQACARAEHAKWAAVIAEREAQIARIDGSRSSMYRRMAINAVGLDIAQRLRISEQQVWRIVEQGTRLRDRAPASWRAFAMGLLDERKASIVAAAIERAKEPQTVTALDKVVVGYAGDHTPAELRRWLNRLIDRLEPLELDKAEAARAERHVSIEHGDNAMSWVNAYVPSIVAVAIGNRLCKAARALDDDRQMSQKEADLFASWLTNATGTECDIKAEIAVVVEAESLAGVTDTPATVDDEAIAPVSWIFGLAESGSTLWTRLLTDPAGHVLDVTHLGYQPPAALREAIGWRDMRCRVAGCNRRAELTDLDHIKPYDSGGPTNGPNLWCLCRRHHGMKGHRLLPGNAFAPPAIHLVRLPSRPLTMEYVAA